MKKKMTIKQKLFHLICYPIFIFLTIYAVHSLFVYLFKGEHFFSSERAFTTSALAIGMTIGHWFFLIYPAKRHSDSNQHEESLKEEIKQDLKEGSAFNKLMLVIYALCIISVIVVIVLSFMGYL